MAKRPIFTPNFSGFPHVNTVDIEFKWHPGFAKSQLQKSIASLHAAAEKLNAILQFWKYPANRHRVLELH